MTDLTDLTPCTRCGRQFQFRSLTKAWCSVNCYEMHSTTSEIYSRDETSLRSLFEYMIETIQEHYGPRPTGEEAR